MRRSFTAESSLRSTWFTALGFGMLFPHQSTAFYLKYMTWGRHNVQSLYSRKVHCLSLYILGHDAVMWAPSIWNRQKLKRGSTSERDLKFETDISEPCKASLPSTSALFQAKPVDLNRRSVRLNWNMISKWTKAQSDSGTPSVEEYSPKLHMSRNTQANKATYRGLYCAQSSSNGGSRIGFIMMRDIKGSANAPPGCSVERRNECGRDALSDTCGFSPRPRQQDSTSPSRTKLCYRMQKYQQTLNLDKEA